MNVIDLLYLYNTGATERYVLIREYMENVFDDDVVGIRTHLKEESNA